MNPAKPARTKGAGVNKRRGRWEVSPHANPRVCEGCELELSPLAFPRVGDGRGPVCRNCRPHGRPLEEVA